MEGEREREGETGTEIPPRIVMNEMVVEREETYLTDCRVYMQRWAIQ